MAFIQGEGRTQGALFPVTLDDLIPADHVCRVLDAFVGRLNMEQLGSCELKLPRQDDLDTIPAIF